jgi:hypothetical protein
VRGDDARSDRDDEHRTGHERVHRRVPRRYVEEERGNLARGGVRDRGADRNAGASEHDTLTHDEPHDVARLRA